MARPQILLCWSSGKDSAWALHVLRQRGDVEVVGLLTTINETFGRVAMHGVREELVQSQADALGLPLWRVPLPWPCTNDEYEARMQRVVRQARAVGITGIAFGDLFLQEIRDYRERQFAGTGVEPLFPIWTTPAGTRELARIMLQAGLRATLTCVDPRRLPSDLVGREWNDEFLGELPTTVDPCGENGEFHTFCHTGPIFDRPIPIHIGAIVARDGFVFADATMHQP